jgi:hypothetical protein
VDFSQSKNSTAQLIGAAIAAKDTITVEMSRASLSKFGGARTVSASSFADPYLLQIELNDGTIASTVTQGEVLSGPLAGARVGLPTSLGTALVHELGHAYGYFEEGAARFPVFGQTNATALRFKNGHPRLMARGPVPVVRRVSH